MNISLKLAALMALLCVTTGFGKVVFHDGFEGSGDGQPPMVGKWSVIAAGESAVVIASDIVTTDGARMARLTSRAMNDRAGIRSNTAGPYKSLKVSANIILDYDTAPHGTCVDIVAADGSIAASLRLVPAEGTGLYDARILCRSASGIAETETIKVGLTVGQWQSWTFAVNIAEERTGKGTLDVLLNGRPVVANRPFHPFTAYTAAVDKVEIWTSKGQTRIDAVVIEATRESQTQARRRPSETFYQPKDLTDVDYDLAIAPSGAMQITVGGQVFTIGSKFSLPGGKWLELHSDGAVKLPIAITDLSEDVKQVEIITASYRILRRIAIRPNHVAVSDEVTNLTGELIGIMFSNEASATGDTFGSKVCGSLRPPVEVSAPERSFVHLVCADALVGLVARDDVYRVQSVCYGTEENVGIRSDHFGMAPGARYTLKWEIYPRASSDYYDFVNTVRQNWGTARRTIPHACGFMDYRVTLNGALATELTDAQLGDWMDRCGVGAWTFIATAGPGEPERPNNGEVEAFGYDYLSREGAQQSIANQSRFARRIQRVRPDIRVGAYTHYLLNAVDDPDVALYRDARIMTEERSPLLWAVRYKDAAGNWLYGYYYPTDKNAFGKMITRMYDKMLSDFGDHVYIDEYGFAMTVSARYMYDVPDWDGHSVVIDRVSHEVVEKVTELSLVTREFRSALTELGGGVEFINLQPATQVDTARDATYFLEYLSIHDYPRGHLASPITYIVGRSSLRKYMGFIYDSLQYGLLPGIEGSSTLHTKYASALKHFFPITIQEIRPGYVLGKERIVTSVPGRYSFGDDSDATVIIYSLDGVPRAMQAKSLRRQGRTYTEVSMAEGEIAIISHN